MGVVVPPFFLNSINKTNPTFFYIDHTLSKNFCQKMKQLQKNYIIPILTPETR